MNSSSLLLLLEEGRQVDGPSLQLELALYWGREPWKGVSPRYLTRAPKKFRLTEPATDTECFTDPAQLTFPLEEGDPNGASR